LVPGSKPGPAGDTGHRFALVVNNDRVFASEVHACLTSDKKIDRASKPWVRFSLYVAYCFCM